MLTSDLWFEICTINFHWRLDIVKACTLFYWPFFNSSVNDWILNENNLQAKFLHIINFINHEFIFHWAQLILLLTRMYVHILSWKPRLSYRNILGWKNKRIKKIISVVNRYTEIEESRKQNSAHSLDSFSKVLTWDNTIYML